MIECEIILADIEEPPCADHDGRIRVGACESDHVALGIWVFEMQHADLVPIELTRSVNGRARSFERGEQGFVNPPIDVMTTAQRVQKQLLGHRAAP